MHDCKPLYGSKEGIEALQASSAHFFGVFDANFFHPWTVKRLFNMQQIYGPYIPSEGREVRDVKRASFRES